ncbi:baeRF2 domain-containing protein [Streptomyces albidoflavus]|uniref:baeRF2 domain-containing protein n=1 Tax=Streptomyces albidoflavus TaxID=1886 RepID=UPI001C453785|nr:hypothetical protein [Streptomyces albidoflavus]MBV7650333.1 hypothetical protein [Streptomyces albidoflavus]MBV7711799.1 hypothetical protein [Streptomyces albidoflavus]
MDLRSVVSLYESAENLGAPVASVHLDTTHDDRLSATHIEHRWRALRDGLAEHGCDEATLTVLDKAVGGVPDLPGPQGESVFAADGRLLGVHTLAAPPLRDQAALLPIPDALALVVDLDHQLPHVVVAVDEHGADVDAFPVSAEQPDTRRTFHGTTLHLAGLLADGPVTGVTRRRREGPWADVADQVAQDVLAAVGEVRARMVAVTGAPQALESLRDRLSPAFSAPGDIPPDLVLVTGGRPSGGDPAALAALRRSVDAALHDATTARHRATLERFRGDLARHRAAEGVPDTATAFARGRATALLLAADRDHDPQLYASATDPRALATQAPALDGDPTAFAGQAGALLLRAAVAAGAEFSEILTPHQVPGGTGALLR